MTVRVGINGFGRIGRTFLRQAREGNEVEVVHINDLTDAKTLAHLLKWDSTFGPYKGVNIKHEENALIIDGKRIPITAERDPSKIPWGGSKVDVVLESTGKFADFQQAEVHLHSGVKKVVISAPAKGEGRTIVLGVNCDTLKPEDKVISNASCTTNCLAPFTKVVHDAFGVKRGLMCTVHSYTNDQRLLDFPHEDLRRSRAACLSIIPTKTGAAAAIGLVIPALKGKLDGYSLRVPTPTVSIVDVTFELEKNVTAEEINNAIKTAAEGSMKGILGIEFEPLVSMDFRADDRSSIVDAAYTRVIDGNLVKIISWYDNEWGYSQRTVDLIGYIGKI